MDSTLVTAMAAIGGSMVGALGTFTGSLITQRYHDRRDLMANQIARRESLYSDFITETARLLVDALETNVVDPKTLIPAYSLLSRMRLSSSPTVLAAADAVLKEILATYSKPNLKPEQIRSGSISGEDTLRNFSEICRNELESMQRQF